MPRPMNQPIPAPTEAELEVLKVLWKNEGPLELGQICSDLRKRRPVATTTVSTVLNVMLEKGLISRRKGPRAYLWSAKADPDSTKNNMMAKLIRLVFDGEPPKLVATLLNGNLSDRDREEIHRLMQQDASGHRTPSDT